MRILTWNVVSSILGCWYTADTGQNVLRTCLDYHPYVYGDFLDSSLTYSFSSMKKKNVEGFLDLLDAQIFCFQGTLPY
jgi:hypothetical protein